MREARGTVLLSAHAHTSCRAPAVRISSEHKVLGVDRCNEAGGSDFGVSGQHMGLSGNTAEQRDADRMEDQRVGAPDDLGQLGRMGFRAHRGLAEDQEAGEGGGYCEGDSEKACTG